MTSTIKEQYTFTINKDLSVLLADFLLNHGYEFRRMYDDRHGVKRNWPSQYPPTLESRRAWLELIALLKGVSEEA